MENSLIPILDFHAILRSHLLATNELLAQSLPWDNIAYAVDSLEFVVPVRQISQQGKIELFVLLSGQMELSDRFAKVRITPEFLAEENRSQNAKRNR